MDGKSSSSGGEKGFFVRRWHAGAAAAFFAVALVAVGLLSAHFSSRGAPAGGDAGREEPPKPKELPYVRLPSSVVPLHYDIRLRPDFDNFTFKGSVRIQVRVLQETANITLHAHNLTWTSTRVSGAEVPAEHDPLRQFLVLRPPSPPLRPGTELEVAVEFAGTLNDQLAGFYRSSYQDSPQGEKRWLATTQFQATDARRAFPCFDEPGFKATFSIAMERPAHLGAISNMPLATSAPIGDGWVLDTFQKTVRMSTYLLAFIVSDFEKRGNGTFGVWSRSSVVNTTSYALEVGPKILSFYETFFDVPYPLPKTDMAAIPDFSAGAMENWGLITYRETALLYDPRYSSAANKQRVATVISHELAHQWFGNLVTPAWWDDLWLNEGFASYVEYLGVSAVHPEWAMEDQFVLDDLQDVFEMDALQSSHPVSVPVRHPDEIGELFDRISYAKGASIIRMMKFFLEDANFKRGLSKYLNDKKYNNSVQDDLWEHLTKGQQGGSKERIDVKRVMDSWTLQTGYPVVEVVRDYSRGTAQLTQRRFLLDPHAAPRDTQSAWEIPFTYTDALNPDWTPTTKLWLHKTNGSLRGLPSRWIVANVQEVGYYRVNYDERNWDMLTQQLQEDHQKIHPVNRAQILDDSLDLARAGQLSYGVALNTTLYLGREEDYVPWKAALHAASHLDLMLRRTPAYGMFKEYLTRQLQPSYDALGWNERPDENILRQYKRVSTLAWLCNYGHKDCLRRAQEKFDAWRKSPDDTSIIPPNLRGVVFCSAVRQGGGEAWDWVWSRYAAAHIASEKDKLMFALSCATEPWLLTRYLERALGGSDGGIRRQDGGTVFRSVASRLYGRDLAFNFVRDKWARIFDRWGRSFFAISSIVKSVTNSLNTPFELQQLRQFYESQSHNLGQAKRAFEQSLENAEANVRWMADHYDDVVEWLQRHAKA